MDYSEKLEFHYKAKKGFQNDPNGLVFFKGYYHVFYQHAPHYEKAGMEPCCWGHARTRDFVCWEELPVALTPEFDYEADGCWSGTAIVKDDVLYLFYASVATRDGRTYMKQSVSVAYSTDGIHFTKYAKNPVIKDHNEFGSEDFRDPAVFERDGKYYLLMATGHKATQTGRLLVYESDNLLNWRYSSILRQWENTRFTECPSVVRYGEKWLIAASVCPMDDNHFFSIMYGDFVDGEFLVEAESTFDKGPDSYAGQIFNDHLGRAILLAWIPGWKYNGCFVRDAGCISLPKEITVANGKITGYPITEVASCLKKSDPLVEITDSGFVVKRQEHGDVIHVGEINEIGILRDKFVLEIYVNHGETVYSILL